MNFPLIGTAKAHSRWSRSRLITSWFLWLAVYLLAFRVEPSFLPLILLCLASGVRPLPFREATNNQRLGGAIAALIVIPLTAVLLGSESALAFLRTTPGIVLLVTVWATSVVADLRFYWSLPPFFASPHATHVT